MISIIVPIYNKEGCLQTLIESVLAQSYKDYELLLIDDGSNDSSYEICLAYSEQNKQIRAFRKENGGVSSARNYGIKRSRGEYLYFVDADDKLLDGCLETLMTCYSNKTIDLVLAGYVRHRPNGEVTRNSDAEGSWIMDKNELMHALLEGTFLGGICAVYIYLFKSSIVFENKLYFDENIHYSEDLLFISEYLAVIGGG